LEREIRKELKSIHRLIWQERFRPLLVVSVKEGRDMTSSVVCFVLGAVFPLVLVGWMIVQG